MAKIGYLFLSRNLATRDEDRKWMKEFGCKDIIEEDGIQEKFRPEWRRMLAHLQHGDEIVVTKLSNALRGTREACRARLLRRRAGHRCFCALCQ